MFDSRTSRDQNGFLKTARYTFPFCILVVLTSLAPGGAERDELHREFDVTIKPFVSTYCLGCHEGEKSKAKFDLSPYQSLESVASGFGHWELVLERLHA